MKCKDCKYCIGYDAIGRVYYCETPLGIDCIDECIADDENMECDLYDHVHDGRA